MAKTLLSFGHSECSRVNNYMFRCYTLKQFNELSLDTYYKVKFILELVEN